MCTAGKASPLRKTFVFSLQDTEISGMILTPIKRSFPGLVPVVQPAPPGGLFRYGHLSRPNDSRALATCTVTVLAARGLCQVEPG